jgi:ketosteroid isomerase-like protein
VALAVLTVVPAALLRSATRGMSRRRWWRITGRGRDSDSERECIGRTSLCLEYCYLPKGILESPLGRTCNYALVVVLKGFTLFVWLIICLSRSSPGQPTGAKDEVLKVDAIYREAVLRSDANALARVFADDILIVHSDGTTDTKANFLDAISSGRLKMRSYERTNVQVRVFGSVAVLFSQTKKIFTYNDAPGMDVDLSTMTYLKRGAQWKIVAIQNTHAPH